MPPGLYSRCMSTCNDKLILASALVIASCLLVRAAAPNEPQAAVEDWSDAEFQSLVEKTNLYVTGLNSVSAAQRTYDRYASWVDVKKGPTGKERYISYGLYEINQSPLDDIRKAAAKGPAMKPALPELDEAVVRLANAFVALEPLVKKAHDYYEQEDYKDDAARLGQELHAQMMPLFQQTFAAEAELRRRLDGVKEKLDTRQLAFIEKTQGRKYHWHLRSYMIAAKNLVALLPESPESPLIDRDKYKARYAELESAYNAFQAFVTENPDEVKKIILGGMAESAVKDFFAASKFLRRTLETAKTNRGEYIEKVGELAKKYNDLIHRTNSLR